MIRIDEIEMRESAPREKPIGSSSENHRFVTIFDVRLLSERANAQPKAYEKIEVIARARKNP